MSPTQPISDLQSGERHELTVAISAAMSSCTRSSTRTIARGRPPISTTRSWSAGSRTSSATVRTSSSRVGQAEVIDGRVAFQAETEDEFNAAIERLTHRHVVAFLSANQTTPGVAGELFFLDVAPLAERPLTRPGTDD